MVFDLRVPDRIAVEAWSHELHGRILFGSSLPELLTEITELTGRMSPLPAWTQDGAIVALEGGTAHVRSIVSELNNPSIDLPIAAVWLQDWSGLRHSYGMLHERSAAINLKSSYFNDI